MCQSLSLARRSTMIKLLPNFEERCKSSFVIRQVC